MRLAAFQVKEKARTFERALLLGNRDLAGSELKEAACRLHRGAHRCEPRVRSEVSRAIAHDASCPLDARVRPGGDADVGVSAIVAQPNVVAREVLSNECRLEKERLLHRVGHRPL